MICKHVQHILNFNLVLSSINNMTAIRSKLQMMKFKVVSEDGSAAWVFSSKA